MFAYQNKKGEKHIQIYTCRLSDLHANGKQKQKKKNEIMLNFLFTWIFIRFCRILNNILRVYAQLFSNEIIRSKTKT